MTDSSPSPGKSPPAVGQATPHAPGAGTPAPTSDDVLSVLEEFEAGLDSLKQLYVQRQALAEDLKRKSEQMATAEAELRTRREELAGREREIAQASASLGDRWKQLETREEEILRELQGIEEKSAALKAREAAALERDARAAEAARQAEQLVAELEARDADLQQRGNELDTRHRSAAEREQELSARAEALERSLVQIKVDRDALTIAKGQVDQRAAQVEALCAAAQNQQRDLDAARAQLEKDRAGLEAATRQLEQQKREAEASATTSDQLKSACDQLRGRLAEADRKLVAQASQLENQRVEHEQVVADLRQQAANVEARLAEARQGQNGSSAAVQDAQRQLDQVKQQLSTAQAALAAAEKAGEERAGQLQAALTCCTDVFEEYESLWKHEVAEHLRTRLELSEAQGKLAAAPAAAPGSLTDDAATEALTDRLRKACEALVQLRDERNDLTARIGSLESELERARESVKQARSGEPTGRSAHPIALKRRRERLLATRALARERSKKIKRAEDALATRFEQCERILGMRQELAEARELITAAQRKTERQRASGKTAALAFYGTAAVALLGVLSWFGTRAAIPGIYAARAIVAADARGRTLGPGEYAEWQTFHESLVADPRLMEVAAERMERRGIVDLGKAGDLAAACKEHLITQSGTAGELLLEWRGEGAERTQRVLDTFVTTFASQANAARERRVDGAVTEIRQPSTAGSERLDTDYRMIAAGVWAGSVVLSFGLSALIWRRLANAKAAFEGSATVDNTLDVRKWNLPQRKDKFPA